MRILVSLRGGLGDIVLYTSVLQAFKQQHPNCELTVGTSIVCEELVRSIPFIDRIIQNFRPRYLRVNRSGVPIYRNRKTGFFDGPFDRCYSMDHPYKGRSYEDQQNLHIIDLGAQILGVSGFERRGRVFLSEKHEDYGRAFAENHPEGYVLIAPFSAQRHKKMPDSLICQVAQQFKNAICLAPNEESRIEGLSIPRIVIPSILDVAAVISRSRYLVGLDSALSHIGASFSVPMTTLHKGYTPARCGVLNDRAQIIDMNKPTEIEDIISRIASHYGGVTRT